MWIVWQRSIICVTVSLLAASTPVLAQSSRNANSGDSQKSAPSASPLSSANSAHATDGSQNGNGPSDNSGNTNADSSNGTDSSRDSGPNLNGNTDATFNRDERNTASNAHTSFMQSLMAEMTADVRAFMRKWENGPDELVPSFMASDAEINAALTKVLNRPAGRRKPN